MEENARKSKIKRKMERRRQSRKRQKMKDGWRKGRVRLREGGESNREEIKRKHSRDYILLAWILLVIQIFTSFLDKP